MLDSLQRDAATHGLIFGPDPATHTHCTLGGMLGNNSCGVHAVMSQFYGPGSRTSDNTHRLEILTYDGLRMWVGSTSEDELRPSARPEFWTRIDRSECGGQELTIVTIPHSLLSNRIPAPGSRLAS